MFDQIFPPITVVNSGCKKVKLQNRKVRRRVIEWGKSLHVLVQLNKRVDKYDSLNLYIVRFAWCVLVLLHTRSRTVCTAYTHSMLVIKKNINSSKLKGIYTHKVKSLSIESARSAYVYTHSTGIY